MSKIADPAFQSYLDAGLCNEVVEDLGHVTSLDFPLFVRIGDEVTYEVTDLLTKKKDVQHVTVARLDEPLAFPPKRSPKTKTADTDTTIKVYFQDPARKQNVTN